MPRAAVVAGFLGSQEFAELATVSFYADFHRRAKNLPGDDFFVGLLTWDEDLWPCGIRLCSSLECQGAASQHVP
jgi:hypothetical protein